ncbi:MAG: alkaline phosphatase [Clostridia bacterium]|nr:alkaline phosphatase [Clostridia bacterium]
MKKLKLLSFLMTLVLLLSFFTSCARDASTVETTQTDDATATSATDESTAPVKTDTHLNGVLIKEYTIIYAKDNSNYNKRAAEFIRDQVKAYAGYELTVKSDNDAPVEHEIVVGDTSREISKSLDADTNGFEFAICADGTTIAMEADYYVIAAAAYFFVETYVMEETGDAKIPEQVNVHQPIVKEAKNYILLIGDGMGPNQTRLFEKYDVATSGDKAYSDGEDLFYGYMFPNQGYAITDSLSGTTDSAAGGTALATGYKTLNSRIGRDKDGNDLQSLTELAGSKGMATAVLSTDSQTGATPASFSAHANTRKDSAGITATQKTLQSKYNTLIKCGDVAYTTSGITSLEYRITTTLDSLSKNENGFFLMYEEAHIDKHCHNSNMDSTFNAVVRFNQAIARFMEYAFYNPNTAVIITADHETGGLKIDKTTGEFSYTSEPNSPEQGAQLNHTSANVPVFAYGIGTEIFHKETVQNYMIPKFIAKCMGVDNFGGPDEIWDYYG